MPHHNTRLCKQAYQFHSCLWAFYIACVHRTFASKLKGAVCAETTADGHPLGGLSKPLTKLHDSIIDLFDIVQQHSPKLMAALLESESSMWQLIHVQWQQKNMKARKNRLLKDAFVHAVLLELEALCWCQDADAAEAFCFLQKKQVLHCTSCYCQKFCTKVRVLSICCIPPMTAQYACRLQPALNKQDRQAASAWTQQPTETFLRCWTCIPRYCLLHPTLSLSSLHINR